MTSQGHVTRSEAWALGPGYYYTHGNCGDRVFGYYI